MGQLSRSFIVQKILKTVLPTPTAAMEAAEKRWFVSGRLLDGQIAIPRAPEPVKIPTTKVGEHGRVNTMSWHVNQHWRKTRQVPSNWNAVRISIATVKKCTKDVCTFYEELATNESSSER